MYCECFFCAENRFSINEDLGLEGKESIIYEDEHVFITPDISPLICGHFLIVTKEHWNSFGNVDENIYNSLIKAKDFLRKKIFPEKGILFFEHGSVIEHTAGSCIDHAHLHSIPSINHLDIDGFIKKSDFIFTEKIKSNYTLLSKFAIEKQPYLFYETNENEEWVYKVDRLPSQFFRLMIASYLSKSYNWKLSYNKNESKELFKQTLQLAKNVHCITDNVSLI